ncbi:hypothetical protein Ciccas_000008 [Cichlidogyrus casuarinus]|uniref:GPI transamidase component PIG-T n=1 Tax=Cichlidogyrus casuarinus TaxID=1844966 RepID=A0ABD2QP68_9PLAT
MEFPPLRAAIYKRSTRVDDLWVSLVNDLSGIFGASIKKLAEEYSQDSPKFSYRPRGLVAANSSVKLAKLPQEVLCTENITPWLKLLPCNRKYGNSRFVIPSFLYKSCFLSLTFDLYKSTENSEPVFVLNQKLTLVYDKRLITSTNLGQLLGSSSNSEFCPPASSLPKVQFFDRFGNKSMVDFNNLNEIKFDLGAKNQAGFYTPIVVKKYLTGVGDFEGGVRATVKNHSNKRIRVVYHDILPWMFLFYASSLKVHASSGLEASHIRSMRQRKRLTSMELVFHLEPQETVLIEYKFRKFLQRFDEYPPDANHGLYLPSASVSYKIPREDYLQLITSGLSSGCFNQVNSISDLQLDKEKEAESLPESCFMRTYSENLLVRMPVPDFSMPFNVLCFVCSVIAVISSTIHKVSTSEFRLVPLK